MAEMKLLGVSLSPFTHRVDWALKIKGVEYELVVEDPQNKSPLLLESNPVHKKIPVLIHNGKPICESMVIVEYIDETFGGPSILPKTLTTELLLVSGLSSLMISVLQCIPAMGKAVFGNGEEQEKAKEECGELLKILDNELKDKKFFVGDKIGFADIAANVLAFWMGIIEEASGVILVTSEKFPNYCAWRENYISCSQVKEYLPSRDELFAHFQSRFNSAAAPN